MRAGLLSTLAIAGLLTACASDVEDESRGEVQEIRDLNVRPKVIGGMRDEERARDNVVAVRIGKGDKFGLCSGSLITPNLVLTALHCVANGTSPTVACDSQGKSHNGNHVGAVYETSQLSVFLGTAPNLTGEPRARARSIVVPESKILCNTDIALIVLDKSITEVTPLPVRFTEVPKEGEIVRSIGYGINDFDQKAGVRYVKDGVHVLGRGPGVTEYFTPLGSKEFEVGKSICQGDSGGPAISESTGAIVGVVSRGGDCHENYGHIYTATTGFDELFKRAFKLAGSAADDERKAQREVSAGGSGCSCTKSNGCSTGSVIALIAVVGFLMGRYRNKR